ncbi:MAG TPA: MBL fold metallo-hydrolase [Dehalococcoidia bacterium]|nr:MBL fold metallo-hydrolase [Dehalococcoidia bacterium]
MKLICCGTAAGPFTARRASSGYILQGDTGTLMLECGPGSIRQALTLGIELRSIDAVVLSHLHEDHCLDLAHVAFQAMYGRYERLPTVYGPPGTEEVARRLMHMHRPNAHLPPLNVVEVDDGDEREIAGYTMLSRETPHAAGLTSHSRRFSGGGRSMVFSGDTRANPELICQLAAGANLLLHECYSTASLERYAALRDPESAARILERLPTTHSEVGDVARMAHSAGVPRLVLTHILPTEDEEDLRATASRFYKGELTIAYDGLTLEV